MKIAEELKKYQWKNIWAGDWNLLDCSDWGEHYLSTLKIGNRPFLDRVVFIVKNGKSTCWVNEKWLEQSSKDLVKIYSTKTKIQKLTKQLENSVDAAMASMTAPFQLSKQAYETYRKVIRNYYIPHVHVKYVGDGLSPQRRNVFLPMLQEARVYAEPVFEETLQFDRKLAGQLSKKVNVKPEILLSLTRDELNKYFDTGKLVSKTELANRYKFSVLIINPDKTYKLLTGAEAKGAEQALVKVEKTGKLVGQTGYAGKVKGKVWVINNPKTPKGFAKGDILVTGMTRPEYLPLMKMAAAFVTDAGGMLSHAAITARELKKPCVIGAKVATKVLKDGDIVEVDANKGTVKIL